MPLRGLSAVHRRVGLREPVAGAAVHLAAMTDPRRAERLVQAVDLFGGVGGVLVGVTEGESWTRATPVPPATWSRSSRSVFRPTATWPVAPA